MTHTDKLPELLFSIFLVLCIAVALLFGWIIYDIAHMQLQHKPSPATPIIANGAAR
jgi:hypothetical protein